MHVETLDQALALIDGLQSDYIRLEHYLIDKLSEITEGYLKVRASLEGGWEVITPEHEVKFSGTMYECFDYIFKALQERL